MPEDATKRNRPESALATHQDALISLLKHSGIAREDLQLYLRAFKAEADLEIWAMSRGATKWVLLRAYPFCCSSGTLGPKRREGDRQIPEGVYYIDRFNPQSKFHLSLGLNYPNASDRILGDQAAPGSDIFIHGGCRTVGCIPITNEGIEVLYVLASWARNNGQAEIPVHIFPFRMTDKNQRLYHVAFPQHQELWQQLTPAFRFFERHKRLPLCNIDQQGKYTFTHTDH